MFLRIEYKEVSSENDMAFGESVRLNFTSVQHAYWPDTLDIILYFG